MYRTTVLPNTSQQENSLPAATPKYTQPTFLMCPPTLFEVDYVINPWMAGNIHRSQRNRAMEQWIHLYRAISDVAEVELIEPQPGSPDMVFIAHAGLVLHGVVTLSSFFHRQRQMEEQHYRRWFLDHGFLVLDSRRETPFEGEGDALFSPEGKLLWAGHGVRSSDCSHRSLVQNFSVPLESLRLVDPRFYHLDTCFCPLVDGYLLYFPQAFDTDSLERIGKYYPEENRIAVSEQDAVHFACNSVNVGHTIILSEVSDELSGRLEQRGFRVVQVPLSEFLKSGGAAKCLSLRLSDLDVTHAQGLIEHRNA